MLPERYPSAGIRTIRSNTCPSEVQGAHHWSLQRIIKEAKVQDSG